MNREGLRSVKCVGYHHRPTITGYFHTWANLESKLYFVIETEDGNVVTLCNNDYEIKFLS